MPGPTSLVFILIGISIILVEILIVRPEITATGGGKVLALIVLLVLPVSLAFVGASEHMDRSKNTQFCLSCHIMEPYGRSLRLDDLTYIPAAHYENGRIPRDEACYTCHTDYAMYGTIRAKIRGLRHVYVQYFGTPMTPIHLYTPFNNRECLHCHLGSRSFEEGTVHNASPAIMAAIKSNQLSCVSSGCHESIHNAAHVAQMKVWEGPQ